MKKISTPTMGHKPAQREIHSDLSPRKTTIAFLRQFARAYRPAPVAGMPGIVLN